MCFSQTVTFAWLVVARAHDPHQSDDGLGAHRPNERNLWLFDYIELKQRVLRRF